MNARRDHSFEIVGAETLECELNQVRAAAAGSMAYTIVLPALTP
jgi:hypothetical protein